MIATSHVIIGGTVGVITGNPAAAFLAGAISHILCDALPHLDAPFKLQYKDNKYDEVIWTKKLLAWAILDSLTAFFITLYFWDKYYDLYFFAPFAWGALGAYLPDFVDVFPAWKDWAHRTPGFRLFHRLHLGAHDLWRRKFLMPQSWFIGTITQIIFVIPCLIYLIK
jgi:hypothetical protein